MRRSAKRAGFVVPFATNYLTEEKKSPSSVGSGIDKNGFMSVGKNEANESEKETAASAEEILKLIMDDSDSEESENTSQLSNVHPVLPLENSSVSRKRKLADNCEIGTDSMAFGEKNQSHEIVAATLTAQEIFNMNSSKKEKVLSSEASYFSVLWCKRSMKKHKKWEGDALLIIKGRSAVLKDLDGKEIASAIGYKIKEVSGLEEGSRFFIGGKECEIQHIVKEDEYLSGKFFHNSTADKPSVVKPIPKMKFVTPLAAASKHESRCDVPKLKTKDLKALYMPEPSPSHQWNHNTKQLPVVDVKVDSFLSQHLRPHQREGIIFMYECILGFRNFQGYGAILGDEMGLGKTLQCIALIWMLCKQGPYGGIPILRKVLIITPCSLVKNWESEFFKWLGKGRIAVFAVGPKRKVSDFTSSNFTVLIISYEMYVRSASALSAVSFDLVICDEGHRLKNVNINTSQTIMRIPTKRRILLTGTPIQNDLEEFYAIVEFVNPGILGPISFFRKIYQDPIVNSQNSSCSEEEMLLGQSRAAELASRISPFFLCRTQDVINKFLPPKFEIVVFCQPSDLQCHLYEHLLKSRDLQSCLLMDGLNSNGSIHLQFIAVLRKLCNHPSLLHIPATQHSEDIELCDSTILDYVRSAFPSDYADSPEQSGKLKVLVSLLATIFAQPENEKVVVVSNFTQTLDVIEQVCKDCSYKYLRLDGSTNSATRLDLVEKFNAPFSKISIFLLSSKAGGVGLNLIGASRIVLYDIDWNPATDLQAMSRVWRDGQKRPVYVYRLLTTGTIEEKIYQRQVAKQGLSGTVINSNFATKSQFSHEELKDIFTFHCDIDCLTHDSMMCTCLNKQARNILEEMNDESSRPCQLGYLKNISNRKNTSMAELFKWNHISEVSQIDVPHSCLEDCHESITFLFTNSVNSCPT